MDVKTYETEKGVVQIIYDDFPENPRALSNFGKIFTNWDALKNETRFKDWSSLLSYYKVTKSGSDRSAMYRDIDSIIAAGKKKGDLILPLSIYEHSGIELYVGTPKDHFDGKWDCSFIGFIIADKNSLKEVFESYYPNEIWFREGEKILIDEINILSSYLNGDVFGYILTDKDTGEEIDSCYGFYGVNGLKDIESYVGKEK